MLFPVANKPLIDWTLESLSKCGVETVVMAVNYMAEAIARYLGSTKYDLGIIYSREERPLDTAGPIKRAEDHLGEGLFLVLNGDVISDVDYQALLEYHRGRGGLATITLIEVPDPSRYGAVELDDESRILRFVEKPEPGRAPSNYINAGIYVFEPEVLEYIPSGRPVSTEREVFPKLAEEDLLYGYKASALWVDIGVPEDYLRANSLLLSRLKELEIGDGAEIDETAQLFPPSSIGERVRIGGDSVIGPNTSISDDVVVGRGCKIENSIIFPGVTIGDHSSIKNSIIGENATLERWVKVETGSLIGDYVTLCDGVTITGEVTICPSKRVKESILEPRKVM
jgi:mannose-1-phosphate guanylyltransferase